MTLKANLFCFLYLTLLASNTFAASESNLCPDLSNTAKYDQNNWIADPNLPFPLESSTQILPHNKFFKARWAALYDSRIECMYQNDYGAFTIMTTIQRNNPHLYHPHTWQGSNTFSICTSTEGNPSNCPFN